jgi:hypothetical protein
LAPGRVYSRAPAERPHALVRRDDARCEPSVVPLRLWSMNRGPLGLLLAVALGTTACASSPVESTSLKGTRATNHRHAPQVAFQGIAYAVPEGWTRDKPGCGLADHTVVTGVRGGSCPGWAGRIVPTTAVQLTAVYGPGFALSWPGRPTSWRGQPAWLSRDSAHGDSAHGMWAVQLTLPLLNASVLAQSGELATAQALLNNVAIRASGRFEVPTKAASVFVSSMAGRDGDGLQRNTTITDQAEIRRFLADLRSLRPITHRACSGSWWPRTALLTFRGPNGSRTYAARFDRCGQVFSGTGASAASSNRLLIDIRRAVPNSGL